MRISKEDFAIALNEIANISDTRFTNTRYDLKDKIELIEQVIENLRKKEAA